MGKLDSVVDMTGMTAMQVNSTNISNIIDELNRNSDQLDAISNSLNIIGRGSLTGTWNGGAGTGNALILQQNHGFGSAPIFLSTFTRSDIAGTYYPIPMWFFNGLGQLEMRAFATTDSTNIVFTFYATGTNPAINITFSWYILQQPAQVPTGS